MWLLAIPLFLATIGMALLAPIAGVVGIVDCKSRRAPRDHAWVGFSTAFALMYALPPYALLVTLYGLFDPIGSPVYVAAAPFGVASAWLGATLWRTHRKRLETGELEAERTALACGGFALAISLALTPWLWGATMFTGGGEFGGEFKVHGNVLTYATHVVPLASALLWQTVTLGRRRRRPTRDDPAPDRASLPKPLHRGAPLATKPRRRRGWHR